MYKQIAILTATMAVAFAAAGCGTATQPFTAAAQPQQTNGNWNLQATSAVYPGFSFQMGGPVQNGVGTFELLQMAEVTNGLCLTPFPAQTTPIALTGTLAAKLVSTDQNGQVFTFDHGTAYAVTGTCGTDHGSVTATLMAPIAGTYQGTLDNGAKFAVTLKQDTWADAQGLFHLAGTITNSSPACGTPGTVSVADSQQDTYVVGNQFLAVFTAAGAAKVVLAGTFNPTANQLSVSVGTYVGRGCQQTATGKLLVRS